MSSLVYRVIGPTGDIVLDTIKAPEAFIKARQIGGRALPVCEICNEIIAGPTHLC